jgi:hypothetical protein
MAWDRRRHRFSPSADFAWVLVFFGVLGRWTENLRPPVLLLLAAPWALLTSATEWLLLVPLFPFWQPIFTLEQVYWLGAFCAPELRVALSIASVAARSMPPNAHLHLTEFLGVCERAWRSWVCSSCALPHISETAAASFPILAQAPRSTRAGCIACLPIIAKG